MTIYSVMDRSDPTSLRRSTAWTVSVSLALHIILIGILLYHHPPLLKATQLPGDLDGHRLLLTYLPGQGSAASVPQTAPPKNTVPDRLPTLRVKATPTPPSAAIPSPSLTANNSTGTDTLGQGDIQIASLLVHPRPAPDLSQLPSGTRGDVVVDIVIDTQGRVAKTTVERGLGHGIDETVLATIQQWTFQPAMRNGVAVSSEQELLFHYERG
jgi:protein TonB